jgi:dihydrofolate synthase/folylpolyglutamate synthase
MYQRVGKAAYKTHLNSTLALDEYFGHPHTRFESIHIAGTNGKGSVAHMLASVLQSAGYRQGLYTSPHLKDFRERIRVDGKMIPEDAVISFVRDHRDILEEIKPSFFEMTVAMAFDHFAKENVEIAVIEVGMGGRLDSTNIITPEVSVITNIGMDHSLFLGNTLEKIAGEKAGIMKHGIPVIIGEYQEETGPLFMKYADRTGCPVFFAGSDYSIDLSTLNQHGRQVMQVYRSGKSWLRDLEVDLLGVYQRKNVITSLKAIELLNGSGRWNLDEDAIRKGMQQVTGITGLRGRWEVLSHNPLIVCDTAHNREGIREVVSQIKQTPWKNLHIILGFVDDKDPVGILRQFPPEALFYFTQASIPRAMDKEKLAMEALTLGIQGQVCMSPASALALAREKAEEHDMIFIGGSTFVVAEVLP